MKLDQVKNIGIIVGILLGVISLHSYFSGKSVDKMEAKKDREIAKIEIEKNSKIAELEDEIRDALSELKASNNSLEFSNQKILELEKENREIRGQNNTLRDSIASVTGEIEKYKSRVVELNEFGSVELFNNQFILSVYEIIDYTNQDFITENKILVDASLYYVGQFRENLRKGERNNYIDYDVESGLSLTQTLEIEYGNIWYVVRLISIDLKNKKAKFSHYISDVRPQ